MIAILQAIILGVIEGLTEFLPISSTGHLLVAEDVLGYKDIAHIFTVVVQLGAIAAVVWHYRIDLTRRVKDAFEHKNGRKFWFNVGIASLPAVCVGLFIEDTVNDGAMVFVVAVALLVGGFILLVAEEHFKKRLSGSVLAMDAITKKQALVIGVSQVTALIPGVSRSGATILGGMFGGLNRVTAAAFSFYLSIPIIIGASGYKLIKDGSSVRFVDGGGWALLCGTVAAFVSALIVISWLLKYISKHDFKIFAYYRIGFGTLLLILLMLGYL